MSDEIPLPSIIQVPDGLFRAVYPDDGFAFTLDLIEADRKIADVITASRTEPPYWWIEKFGEWLKEKTGHDFRQTYVRNLMHELRVENLRQKKEQDEQLTSMLNLPPSTDSTPDISDAA